MRSNGLLKWLMIPVAILVLFAGIRLAYQQIININTQVLGINRVEGMLGVDKGTTTPGFLCFGDYLKSKCGFT